MSKWSNVKNLAEQEKALEQLRKTLPYHTSNKDYMDYLEAAIIKEPKHYGFIDKNLKIRIRTKLL